MRLLLVLLFSFSAVAQLPEPVLNAAQRREIAEAFAAKVDSVYVLPDEAKKMAASVRDHIKRGDYDNLASANQFAEAVLRDARSVNDDRHLRLSVTPNVLPTGEPKKELTPETIAFFRRVNNGIAAARILEGNVGYLDVELFPPVEVARPTADAAMAFLANTDALIVDARRHRGGEPAMVAYLVSHFVEQGTLINTIYSRDMAEPELYRASKIPGKRYDKKVYVLTSSRTFSGGEELAYDLQSLGRGKIYGEVTGGGAHPTQSFRIHDRFSASIPRKRSVNPITKTNWEGVGVKPDVPVPADDALRVAHAAALEELAASASGQWKTELQNQAAKLKVAATPAAANANPRAALDAWIKSFNEHDAAAREQWLRANTSYSEEDVKKISQIDQQIKAAHGPFELVRVMNTKPLSIEVEAKHTKSGAKARIEIELDPEKTEKIKDVTLEGMQ